VIERVPAVRLAAANDRPVRPDGDYVLYWMIAARRTRRSFALEHALWHAQELGRPLLVLEALRVGYPWASARFHRFVLDGMADNVCRLEERGVRAYPYVEPRAGEGSGLLEALAERACVVVTDEYPCFFLPRMVRAAAAKLPVRLETVDGNGILPLRATDRDFPTAASFRRHLQKTLPEHLGWFPLEDPLRAAKLPAPAVVPRDILRRWPRASAGLLDGSDAAALRALPIDHGVAPAALRGGPEEGARVLARFLDERLDRYGDGRNHPDEDSASGLSPWLHFGHVSAHDVVAAVLEREDWNPLHLGPVTGSREGWWGVGRNAESFLDEAVTWRELGHVFNFHRPDDYDRWESLPPWARRTLQEHRGDPRPSVYDLEELAEGATHDPLWNAAQRELREEGRLQNYLRMLWGKKILEWSPDPRAALEAMIELNNRYALDGRDPNSYSGIFWVLGRFDRPWGPEREIFGKIRYMSSENTARKLRMRRYVARYGDESSRGPRSG